MNVRSMNVHSKSLRPRSVCLTSSYTGNRRAMSVRSPNERPTRVRVPSCRQRKGHGSRHRTLYRKRCSRLQVRR
jgi:hypothetical protein